MRRRRAGNRGWTLLELVITGSVVTIATSAALEFFLRQADFLDTVSAQADVRSQAQLAMQTMVAELRHATRRAAGSPPNIVIPAAPNNTTLTFYRPIDLDGNGVIVDGAGNLEWDAANPVQYQWVAATRQLVRTIGAANRVIANGVSTARFDDQAIDPSLLQDEVRVTLTIQQTTSRRRTISETLQGIVQLRN